MTPENNDNNTAYYYLNIMLCYLLNLHTACTCDRCICISSSGIHQFHWLEKSEFSKLLISGTVKEKNKLVWQSSTQYTVHFNEYIQLITESLYYVRKVDYLLFDNCFSLVYFLTNVKVSVCFMWCIGTGYAR